MKKLSIALSLMLLATISYAQKIKKENVPPSVMTAFEKAYPSVTKVKWDKEGSKYEASFEMKETDYSVLMDANGMIEETEIGIAISELPTSVVDYTKANYAGKKMKEAAKLTDAKGIVTYEVEIRGMDLIFDNSGKFIKAVKG